MNCFMGEVAFVLDLAGWLDLASKDKESSGREGRTFWVMGTVKQMIRAGYFRGDSSH